MKWSPHGGQRKGVRWILEKPEAGIFFPPGLGKTSLALRAVTTLRKARTIDGAMVLAPLSAINAWSSETRKWDFARGLRVEVVHGPNKKDILARAADIYVFTYDGLKWLDRQRWRWPRMLIADESHKLKHHKTARYGHLKSKLRHFHRRVALTGTPRTNGLQDLWAQLYVLDLGQRLHPYKSRFENEFFTRVSPGVMLPHPDAQTRVRERIQDVCLYVDPKDYLKLPPLIESTVPVKLSPKMMEQYRRLETEFFLKVEEGVVTVANAGVMGMKLRQVVNGAVYHGDRRVAQMDDTKIEAVLDRIEEGGESALVAYEFDHERERLEEAFKKEGWHYARMTGSPKQRKKVEDAWNRGALDVLLTHPGAASLGVNLQHGGGRIIWLGPTWNLEHWIQLYQRVYRQGRTERVFLDVVVAEKTIDEHVLTMLQDKDMDQRELFMGLKKYGGRL